ncbi:MAG TPA: M13 family metallopeptidase [Polyangiaceae bacterium]
MRASSASLVATALVIATAAACGGEAPPPAAAPQPPAPPAPVASAAAPAPEVAGQSIDRSSIDTAVKPGADFYLFANGSWYAKAEIPADRPATGIWLKLTQEIEKRLGQLIDDVAHADAPAGSSKRKIADFYAAFMDDAAIEKRGLAPIQPELARIARITDAKSLAAYLGSELRADVDALNSGNVHTDRFLGVYVDGDLNDPSKNAAYLMQGGLGMPDRSFYLDDAPQMAQHRAKYEAHLAAMLKLAKIADPEGKAKKAAAIEKRIAQVHVSRSDAEDVAKANNPWPRAEFAKRAPGFEWDAFFKAAGLDKTSNVIVWMPSAIVGEAALVKDVPIADWKAYLTARAIDRHGSMLPKAFYDERFAFYGTEIAGVPTPPPRTRRAIDLLNELLTEQVGREYVARWFPAESKQTVQQMVTSIVEAFRHRIDALTWMADSTKAKAKAKLDTLRVGIGYPDQWADDSALVIKHDDAYGNVERAERWDSDRRLASIGQPLDRGKWEMPAQVVNAQNLPIRNALSFPAGILVAPFFDPSRTAAANYGAIGAVMGHEISHSFDNQGATFDAQGRFVNWWTPEDFAHFDAAGQALAAQFSTYKPYPDVAVDGKQCLAEDLADLAGLAAAYDAWHASLGGAPPPTQDGFTGDQQFFLSFAQTWQTKMRETTERTRLKIDTHAPPHYRVFTVRNIDAWYSAFDVQPGDAMFLASADRVRVW